jgi:hypothetical protein
MSDARRRTAEPTSEPKAKVLVRPTSDAWRVEMSTWSDADRFAWLERVAIMLADDRANHEQVQEAEQAAFADVAKHLTR